jgi:hypothetical protein
LLQKKNKESTIFPSPGQLHFVVDNSGICGVLSLPSPLLSMEEILQRAPKFIFSLQFFVLYELQ